MKKIVFLLTILSPFILQAQTNKEGIKIKTHKISLPIKAEMNFPGEENFDFVSAQNNENAQTKNEMSAASVISPSKTIEARTWGKLTNFEDNRIQLYSMDYTFGTGAKATIKMMDNNLNITKEFSFDIPSTTNSIKVSSQISKFEVNGNTKTKFFVFLHYFEGGIGPNYQRSIVWLMDEDANILKKFTATVPYLLKGTDSQTKILTYINNDSIVKLNLYNANTLDSLTTLEYDSKLFANYSGSPVNFINVGGSPKIVVCHYEKEYMDISTLATSNNNHLLLSIYDNNFNFEKQVSLPVPDVAPETYVYGLAEFGMFYKNNKYDITNHVFNSDDNYEYLYSIYYNDMINDKTWRNYYVCDDQGNVIKKLEENIITSAQMNEINGQEDQMSFVLGSGDVGSSIKMFNIPSWTTVVDFPATYNGDKLSIYYNRMPADSSYQYLIGLSNSSVVDGTTFGLINKYSPAGELTDKVQLNVGPSASYFYPLLNTDNMQPKVFNQDDDMEYCYVYGFKYAGSTTIYTSFNVAKDSETPLLTVNGNPTFGNITSSGFLRDDSGKINKLHVSYVKSGLLKNTTEFYDVPFASSSINQSTNDATRVYYNRLSHEIVLDQTVKSFAIYNATGQKVRSGSNQLIKTAGWNKGLYVVKCLTEKGSVTQKIILN